MGDQPAGRYDSSLFIKNLLFSGKARLWKYLFSFLSPVTKFGSWTRDFGKQRNRDVASKVRSLGLLLITTVPHTVLTISEKLIVHVLACFFGLVECYDHCCCVTTMILGLRGRGAGPYMARRPPRSHFMTLTHRTRSLKRCVKSCWPG